MRQKETIDLEAKISAAIQWHSQNPTKNTIRQSAQRYNIPNSTLHRRLNGGRTFRESREATLLLSPAEENILADAVLAHADRGFPVRVRQLKAWATQILSMRDPTETKVGSNWHSRFLRRFPDINIRLRQTMDRVRVKAADPASIAEFYELVCKSYFTIHNLIII